MEVCAIGRFKSPVFYVLVLCHGTVYGMTCERISRTQMYTMLPNVRPRWPAGRICAIRVICTGSRLGHKSLAFFVISQVENRKETMIYTAGIIYIRFIYINSPALLTQHSRWPVSLVLTKIETSTPSPRAGRVGRSLTLPAYLRLFFCSPCSAEGEIVRLWFPAGRGSICSPAVSSDALPTHSGNRSSQVW